MSPPSSPCVLVLFLQRRTPCCADLIAPHAPGSDGSSSQESVSAGPSAVCSPAPSQTPSAPGAAENLLRSPVPWQRQLSARCPSFVSPCPDPSHLPSAETFNLPLGRGTCSVLCFHSAYPVESEFPPQPSC